VTSRRRRPRHHLTTIRYVSARADREHHAVKRVARRRGATYSPYTVCGKLHEGTIGVTFSRSLESACVKCMLVLAPRPSSITCPRCDMTSHHPKDVEHGYCGNCNAFTGATP